MKCILLLEWPTVNWILVDQRKYRKALQCLCHSSLLLPQRLTVVDHRMRWYNEDRALLKADWHWHIGIWECELQSSPSTPLRPSSGKSLKGFAPKVFEDAVCALARAFPLRTARTAAFKCHTVTPSGFHMSCCPPWFYYHNDTDHRLYKDAVRNINASMSHEMSWDVMRCHEMSWDVMRCHEMSWVMWSMPYLLSGGCFHGWLWCGLVAFGEVQHGPAILWCCNDL